MSTGQFPRVRMTAKEVYDDLRGKRRAATDRFGSFLDKPRRRKRGT